MWDIIRIVFYFIIIIGLIYLAARIFKRKIFQSGDGQYLQVIERMYFAPKRFLSLVRVKDRVILFSISEKRIQEVQTWALDEFEDFTKDNSTSSFPGYFKKYFEKYRRDDSENN